jgi:hypothetical protein
MRESSGDEYALGSELGLKRSGGIILFALQHCRGRDGVHPRIRKLV